jgi:hypothetical protein
MMGNGLENVCKLNLKGKIQHSGSNGELNASTSDKNTIGLMDKCN